MVPAGKQISIAEVIKSRALIAKDFELYEKAAFLAEDEAIRVLSQYTAADPSFPYEYSQELGQLMIVESLNQVVSESD